MSASTVAVEVALVAAEVTLMVDVEAMEAVAIGSSDEDAAEEISTVGQDAPDRLASITQE